MEPTITPKETEDNFEQQREECLALASIYGDDFLQLDDTTICITFHPSPGSISLTVYLPATYPSASSPLYEITTSWPLPSDSAREKIDTAFEEIAADYAGQVLLFAWAEWLREFVEEEYGTGVQTGDVLDESETTGGEESVVETTGVGQEAVPDMSELPVQEIIQRQRAPDCPTIHTSCEPIVDRKSVFVAHCATVKTVNDVKKVMDVLLSDKKIARATHNISAYRIVEPTTGVIRQDCDDDGETAAGSRLLHLLQLTKATNVLIVVTRWYGGIHLGPARFKHINNVARQLLEEHRYVTPSSGMGGSTVGATSAGKKKR
ncbi:hypothetical protein HK102_006797 [Quaeritorhiza haematococci]|nr:hypothetical protein HK102_006797 [Quaeritorhiza haematococci]